MWDTECVHANLAVVLVTEKVVMQSLLNASVFFKYKKAWMCLCITLCAGLKVPGCTYECLSLVVCVSEGMCTF